MHAAPAAAPLRHFEALLYHTPDEERPQKRDLQRTEMNFFASLLYKMALALHCNFLTGIRKCSGIRSQVTILHEVSATILKGNVSDDLSISALVPTAPCLYTCGSPLCASMSFTT